MTARGACRPAACGGCELGRARWHLERAAAELEEASLAWGVWADGVRTLAERRLGVSAAGGFAVLDDPGYARALRMGAWYELLTERIGRPGRSLILTSNRSPADWYPLFPNAVVGESILDRVLNTSHHLLLDGKSYRPRRRPGQHKPAPAAPRPP